MKKNSQYSYIWAFVGENSQFPTAVFDSKSKALEWASQFNASGGLYKLPLNTSVYAWSVESEFFKPKKPLHEENKFIYNFTSAYIEDCRVEGGREVK